MHSPWKYVEVNKASRNQEHVQQVALFQYCNMAANFGLNAADQHESYTTKGYAAALLERTLATGVDLRVPELNYLFAIHNQGHGDEVHGARAKAEGLKTGVSDICLPVCYSYWLDEDRETIQFNAGLYIELKRPTEFKAGQRKTTVIAKRSGNASTDQERWQAFLRQQGYVCEIRYGWEAARDLILSYLRAGGIIR